MNIRKIALLSLLATGALATGAAQARDDVQWSITFGNGAGVPVVAAPVYSAPVYGAPVYVPAPARVIYPAPVVVHPGWRPARWDVDGDGIPNRYDPVDNRYYRGHGHGHGYDRDRDGIPDRWDRVDNRRFQDRDRDGVPDRWDRRDDRRDWHR
ncbi:hypothetical protein BurJ1DRAFT_4402 [Burkholderiales bacterium JOSHI_001]|nr:hypothetical protein BurJ1DRAFT_4402 [Burkholderiales bacterium JOSHI_001]